MRPRRLNPYGLALRAELFQLAEKRGKPRKSSTNDLAVVKRQTKRRSHSRRQECVRRSGIQREPPAQRSCHAVGAHSMPVEIRQFHVYLLTDCRLLQPWLPSVGIEGAHRPAWTSGGMCDVRAVTRLTRPSSSPTSPTNSHIAVLPAAGAGARSRRSGRVRWIAPPIAGATAAPTIARADTGSELARLGFSVFTRSSWRNVVLAR